jgi:hypothetical protein
MHSGKSEDGGEHSGKSKNGGEVGMRRSGTVVCRPLNTQTCINFDQ